MELSIHVCTINGLFHFSSTSRIKKPVKGDNRVADGGKKNNRNKRKWDPKYKKNKRRNNQEPDSSRSQERVAIATKNIETVDDLIKNEIKGVQHNQSDANEMVAETKSPVAIDSDTKSFESSQNECEKSTMNTSAALQSGDIHKEENKDNDPEDVNKPKVKLTSTDPTKPTFRVTCNRGGVHNFDSMGAAANFGGAVNNYFNWNVDMKKFDFEVILVIQETEVRVGMALTTSSLHKRNITNYGRTTLRPTIAHSLLRYICLQSSVPFRYL